MSETDPASALVRAVCDGRLMLPQLDDAWWQRCARVNLVCVVSPDLGYPPMDQEGVEVFLGSALAGVEDEEAAKQVDLNRAFREFIGEVRAGWLDEIVPATLRLPDGSRVPLVYSEETDIGRGEAEPPAATVCLDAILAWNDHPFVCEGLVAVRLVLCDARGKRMGETFDWPRQGSE